MASGFYMAGFFDRGRKAKVIFQREKPFEIDNINGEVNPKAICVMERNRNYVWATNWFFFENKKISDIDKDVDLRKSINLIWEDWCKEHNRKCESVLFEDEKGDDKE